MVATIGPLDETNMARVVQLINKTNQFNVTTRRRDRGGVEALIAEPGVEHFWLRLRDRFADHGLIAVVIAKPAGASLEIDTLLMSCRVIGRGVETLMRNELAERAGMAGYSEIRGVYVPTPRNKLVAELFPKLGFTSCDCREDGTTIWNFSVADASGDGISIEIERPRAAASADNHRNLMDINERLTDVFRSVFNDESIELSDDMTASDIDEWDSIAHINLIFAVEEEFGIKFSTGDLNSLGSVGDLRSAVGKRIGGA